MERELSAALRRAAEAERRLESERKARDVLNLAVLDHAATKDKNYAISARLPQEAQAQPEETQEAYHERLKAGYPDLWGAYQQFAIDAGKPESEALDWLDRHHRGLPMPFELQQEN